jgi:hypothetical protein
MANINNTYKKTLSKENNLDDSLQTTIEQNDSVCQMK